MSENKLQIKWIIAKDLFEGTQDQFDDCFGSRGINDIVGIMDNAGCERIEIVFASGKELENPEIKVEPRFPGESDANWVFRNRDLCVQLLAKVP